MVVCLVYCCTCLAEGNLLCLPAATCNMCHTTYCAHHMWLQCSSTQHLQGADWGLDNRSLRTHLSNLSQAVSQAVL